MKTKVFIAPLLLCALSMVLTACPGSQNGPEKATIKANDLLPFAYSLLNQEESYVTEQLANKGFILEPAGYKKDRYVYKGEGFTYEISFMIYLTTVCDFDVEITGSEELIKKTYTSWDEYTCKTIMDDCIFCNAHIKNTQKKTYDLYFGGSYMKDNLSWVKNYYKEGYDAGDITKEQYDKALNSLNRDWSLLHSDIKKRDWDYNDIMCSEYIKPRSNGYYDIADIQIEIDDEESSIWFEYMSDQDIFPETTFPRFY